MKIGKVSPVGSAVRVGAILTIALVSAVAAQGAGERILLIEVHPASARDSAHAEDLARSLTERLRPLAGSVLPLFDVRTPASANAITAGNASNDEAGRSSSLADRARVVVSRGTLGDLYVANVTIVPARGDALDFRVAELHLSDLADELTSQLIFRISRRIRIGMLHFPMRRGDTTQFGGLDRSLPAMLGEGLMISPRITLVESLGDAQLEQLYESIAEAEGLHDQRTAVTLGRRLHANYLVMGEYWELNNAIRVDLRCVNIETGEVVISRGLNITDVTIERIHQEMAALAASLRSIIENDFTPRARPRYLAVSGRSPYPDTPENHRILEEIVRVAYRKAVAARHDSLRVRMPTHEQFRRYQAERMDALLVTAQLEADYLFTFGLNRFDRDSFEVDLAVFDPLNPGTQSFHRIVTASIDQVDRELEQLIEAALESVGITLNDEHRAAWRAPKYRGLYDPFGLQIQVGPSIRGDEALYLGVGGGIVLEGGLTWIPFDSGRWMIQPLNLRFDVLGKRRDRVVVGGDLIFTNVNYRFRPHRTLNPYIGASFGYLGVFRSGTGDRGFDARMGYGLAIGVEHTFDTARRLTYQLRWLRATDAVAGQTLGSSAFPGGRPGGLYLTLGTYVF